MIIRSNYCLMQLCTFRWWASEALKYVAAVLYYCVSKEIFVFVGLQWGKCYHICYCLNSIFCGNKLKLLMSLKHIVYSRSQWSCGLIRGSAAARLLGLCARIPPGSWMFVCCVCCVVLSGRGFCIGLVTRPEESCRVWFIQWVWSRSVLMGGHELESGSSATGKKFVIIIKSYSSSTNTN